jgi:hypothetical protein
MLNSPQQRITLSTEDLENNYLVDQVGTRMFHETLTEMNEDVHVDVDVKPHTDDPHRHPTPPPPPPCATRENPPLGRSGDAGAQNWGTAGRISADRGRAYTGNSVGTGTSAADCWSSGVQIGVMHVHVGGVSSMHDDYASSFCGNKN